jgi:signal transduction histidine kinase
MRLLPERTLSSIILVVSLTAILITLAALQYQWSGEVSEAEHERMHTSLLASLNQFRLQFDNEFRQIGFLFQPDGTALIHKDWNSYAANCSTLLSRSDHRLIRNIYLWVPSPEASSQLLRLNRNTKSFEAESWPDSFNAIKARYERFFINPPQPDPEIRPFMWRIFQQIPLMLQPITVIQRIPDSSGPRMQFIGFLLIELDLDSVRHELLPELAKKYFEGPDGFIYQVAVVSGRNPGTVLYQSDPHLAIESFARADARIDLFENPRERFGPMGPRPELSPDQRPGRGPAQSLEEGPGPPGRLNPRPPMPQFRMVLPAPEGRRTIEPVPPDAENAGWALLTKHRTGSLETAVAGQRRRTLAISFGILVLLAGSMALIIVSARRSQSLARLQIDFVAGISHELRTPLAVICSAGDNLAEGVIANTSEPAKKYGELIRNEARKLTGMIEQILQFASVQRNRRRYTLRPEDINEIALAALKQAKPAIAAAGFSIDVGLAPNLPRISVDATALSQAIQNLIQNALKYSAEGRWLAIKTEKVPVKRGTEVQLTVEDRGMGIAGEDLPHIFEPFYRGTAAAAAQIHGTGLGLYMAREALVSMGGNISVKSSPGKGCIFTLHFPALPASGDSTLSAASEENSKHAVQNTVD